MGREDWYRRTTWSDADEDQFRARLKRSRTSANKSQYLRVQAVYLAEAGHHTSAIQLLDEMIRDYPQHIELAQAYLQKAESLVATDFLSDAVDEYRASLEAERLFPGVKTGCWLLFPWFIVKHNIVVLYDEATDILQEFNRVDRLAFPIDRYRYAAICALLLSAKGEDDVSRKWAKEAMQHAKAEHSGFRHHPNIGLVKNVDLTMHDRLVKLVE